MSAGPPDSRFASLHEQAGLLAGGQLGAVELAEATLDRVIATQPTLNAFRRLNPERVRAEARDADRRLAAGERLPLLGVPVAIKDDVDMAGEPTAFGMPGNFPAKAVDCEFVRRLRLAGAVIVGKTNAPEIGQGPFTEATAFGATRNPWSLAHTPGGSSGGAAAAVAGGLVAAAVGSDGAGSVRVPAAWTNLVGLKPQRGRVSTWPEPQAFNGLTTYGPLARTVADAALLLDVLSGNVDGDLHRPPAHDGPYAAAATRPPRRPLRIALAMEIPFSGAPATLAPDVRAGVERLATSLESLGHRVEPAEVGYGVEPSVSLMLRAQPGITEWARRSPEPERLDPRIQQSAKLGRALRPLLGLAHFAEEVARRRLGRVFRRHDLILTPATAQPPLPIGACDGLGGLATARRIIAAAPYAWPWNVVGWPAVAVPAGLTAEGLPVGAQLLGLANSEPLLLSLAAQMEEVERWHERRPPAGAPVAAPP